MLRSIALVSAALFLSAACGDNGGNGGDDDDDAGSADAAVHNPPNPDGLGPAPLDLGSPTDLASAGAYVILAKAGVTNVTGSAITGNVGVSPAAASDMTGFSQTDDASGVFSTSPAVLAPGKIYASDYAVPTPANLTAAILSQEAAYADAASRTTPDFLNLGSGEIGGETLAPGLYTWGTGVNIPDAVTIAGGANDVWIFQISQDLDVSAATSVILSGGALPDHIYWQVAGTVTIHADAHFEGIILSSTGITLQTGASMNGRALAQTLIAIDDNAITAP
jgi:hypothetical protein